MFAFKAIHNKTNKIKIKQGHPKIDSMFLNLRKGSIQFSFNMF